MQDLTPHSGNRALPGAPPPDGPSDDAALLAELGKWRERVPKLAAALRQRSEEVDALKAALEASRAQADRAAGSGDAAAAGGAGIRARDELIAELEAKLADLAERHKVAQGELHARQLTIDELGADLAMWKDKWRSLTRNLDDQAEAASTRDERLHRLEQAHADALQQVNQVSADRDGLRKALDEARSERDSLHQRNEQLFETTEFANRQITSLTDSLADLRQSLRAEREQVQALTAQRDQERQQAEQDAARAEQAASETEREVLSLRQQLTEAQDNARGADERVAAAQAAATQAEEQAARSREAASEVELEAGTLRLQLAETQAEAREAGEQLAVAQAAAESAAERTKALEAALAETCAARDALEHGVAGLSEELHQAQMAVASGEAATADLEFRIAEAQRARQAAQDAEAGALERSHALEADVAHQGEELARLADVVSAAQRTTEEREQERRALSEDLQQSQTRIRHLEQQLAERSSLVRTLEQDQTENASRCQALEQQRDELEEALMRAERHVRENADHVSALDAKLERQKELMLELESELAEVRNEQAQTRKLHNADAADRDSEVEALQTQVRKLEGLIRERTESLNQLEWQRGLAAEEAAEEAAETAKSSKADLELPNPDAKLMLVLNQQLESTRKRNEELLERVRELEAAVDTQARRDQGDDLTRIHGVGQKLAEQLNDLGIYRFQQIAELDEAGLDEENHVLHSHRGRILRDGWIQQAAKLIRH